MAAQTGIDRCPEATAARQLSELSQFDCLSGKAGDILDFIRTRMIREPFHDGRSRT